jgi:hypothetical protein
MGAEGQGTDRRKCCFENAECCFENAASTNGRKSSFIFNFKLNYRFYFDHDYCYHSVYGIKFTIYFLREMCHVEATKVVVHIDHFF